MKTFYQFLVTFIILMGFTLNANNVQVSNVTLINQNVAAGVNNPANHTFVRFSISWDNSWRTSTGPGNYDAAWVFVKFQPFGGNYNHATLSTIATQHNVTTNNGVPVEFKTVPDGVGVFIQRSGNGGPASNNWQDVLLRWNYPANGVLDNQSVTVQVFAVEMVFVPQASFYLGDGNINQAPSSLAFRINNVPSTTPRGNEAYLVTSESALTFVNNTNTSTTGIYDPNVPNGYTLAASYPKGFRAFYTMKYETSQRQYADFFNTLPTAPISDPQKGARNVLSGSFRNCFNWSGNNLDDAQLNRFGIAAPALGSGDRAQNFMGWSDAIAFADWSGLRPMSEFEYEKICRGNDITFGPIYPILGEFAWGNTIINFILANGIIPSIDNSISEGVTTPSTNQANCNAGNVNLNSLAIAGNREGPVRCGIFAAKNFTTQQRRQAGASFYGVMELTGNIVEMAVAPGSRQGSCFGSVTFSSIFDHNINGNGVIPGGNSDVVSWNTLANVGAAGVLVTAKGGSFLGAASASFRQGWTPSSSCSGNINPGIYSRNSDNGFRAVRSTFNP